MALHTLLTSLKVCLKGHKLNPLLCEQVVGRGLRRASYEVGADGLLTEEVAKVFGVPFQIVPFKTNPAGSTPPPIKRHHVRALPERKALEIRFPRVEGYTQQVRNRIRVDWETVPGIVIEPGKIPPEVEVKALHSTNTGRLSLHGPGRIDKVELAEFRARRRLQELVFDVAGALTRQYREQNRCEIPANALFPQMAAVVDRYVRKKVRVLPPADLLDLFLAPYYGWLVEALRENIRGDETRGESPELPLLEPHRGPGTTGEVDFWTSREVRQVVKSHVNAVVADTKRWEQSAAYYLDTHPEVESFVKNAGLGLGIPYFWNGEMHEYVPDFIVRLKGGAHLILETKGFDDRKDAKLAAARRWCDAVNAVGGYGTWHYRVADAPEKVGACVAGVG